MLNHYDVEGYLGEVKFRASDVEKGKSPNVMVYGHISDHVAGAAIVVEHFAIHSDWGKSHDGFGTEYLVALEDLDKAPLFEVKEALKHATEEEVLEAKEHWAEFPGIS